LVIWIVVAMLLIVVLACVVVVYVAFPHRGEEVPNAPWVGEAMRKGVNALPTLDNQREQQ
jgi:heme/copper-type cytochrome/quinol oxidase subunit 2